MNNPSRVFWQNMRAALIKQAHDLQEQRAAVLAQAAEIQKMLAVEDKMPISYVGVTFTKDQKKAITKMLEDKKENDSVMGPS